MARQAQTENAEGKVFSDQQRRTKLVALAALVGAGGAIIGLLVMLSPGNTFEVYGFGDRCDTDCGQQPGNALRCVKLEPDQSYCSRPCGESFPSCPAGFSCEALDASAAVIEPSSTHDRYCLRQGEAAAAARERARPAAAVQGQVAFTPLTVRHAAEPSGAPQRAAP